MVSKSTTPGVVSTNTPVSAREIEPIPIQKADVEETSVQCYNQTSCVC